MKLSIDPDKKLHLFVGYALTLTIGLVFDIRTGIASGVLIGIGKELFDYYDYGTFDKRDMFFTWVGTALAGLLMAVLP